MVATVFDSAYKSAGITLSGGNLVATIASGTSNVLASRTCSGLNYGQFTVGASLTGNLCVGLANRSYNTAAGTLLGTDSMSLGYKQDGTVRCNNVLLATIQTFAAAAVIDVAYNPLAQLIWFRTNNGNWNNNAANDPATNTGGISTFTLGSYHFGGACCFAIGGTTVTPNMSITAVFTSGFTYTAPSGYITVDTLAFVAKNCAVGKTDTFTTYKAAKTSTVSSASKVATSQPRRSVPLAYAWYGKSRIYSPAGTAKAISGTVKEVGVAAAGKVVYLYSAATGEYLGTAISDGSGLYSIPALGKTNLFAVAFDPTTYQAMVYDQLAPV